MRFLRNVSRLTSHESLATNGKFAMAMPPAESVARVTHQPQQAIWRVNTMDCGRRGDPCPCQHLDNVKKMTPRSLCLRRLAVGEEKNWRSERRETRLRSGSRLSKDLTL